MIIITLNLDTNKATINGGATIVAGVSVPVQILCFNASGPASPGTSPVFELALGTDSAPPSLLAYANTFSAQNESTYTGDMDANDTRLLTAIATKASLSVNCELRWTVGGLTQSAPHFGITVQPPIITPGASTEGGPVYQTQAEADARYAPLTQVDQSNGKTYRLVFVNGIPSGIEI